MSEKFNYKSPLAPYMKEFVGLKTSSGVSALRTKWILLEIDKFYMDNGITVPTVTGEIVSKWRKTRVNDASNTIYTKYSVWNQLARFMCRLGIECYITPLPEYRNSRTGFTPYIFTREQMSSIMKKSGELRLHDRHMTCSINVMPALVRLLYSTGLRISEALSLRNGDVNLNESYIIIRKSKNGDERIVPLGDTMKSVLLQFLSYRDRMPIAGLSNPDSFVFVKMDGTPCACGTIYTWFRRILYQCGIPHIGNHRGPRVHDIRHTFAVHSLGKMAKTGMDLYTAMPVLSTCLGHKSLSATEQYVRLTMEEYPALATQTAPVNTFVYPKVRKGVDYED